MPEAKRELSAAARRHVVLANIGFPAFVIAGLWVLYASVALFDIDIIQILKRRERERQFNAELVYLGMAIVGTVVALAFAWFNIRRGMHLATHGIPVACEVVKVGKLSVKGMVRIDYEYEVDGTTYRQTLSCPRVTAKRYQNRTELLEIVYDPEDPKRVMLKSEVFPKSMDAHADPGDAV